MVALGSYARSELCASSDIDLLLLHDGWSTTDLEGLVRAVCYPLWDAGLSVGHAVQTPRQAVQAGGGRIEAATALMERRLVAGEQGLLDDLGARWGRWLRRHGPRLLVELAAADQERHALAGDRPGMLEPDLKRGAGGLRDCQSLEWAAACLLSERGLAPLVGARYLGAQDLPALRDAFELLLTVRCALHQHHGAGCPPGRAVDTLRLDLHDDVAARLGWGDGDALLRHVGLASRRIAHLHRRAWPRLLADARGGRRRAHPPPELIDDSVMLVDGLVEVAEDGRLADDPSLGMRTVAAAATRGVHLGRRTAAAFERELAARGSPLAWDERSRLALIAMLRRGPDALPALADADQIGLLTTYLPGWADVRGHPQRNPFHTFDVDTHLVQTVAELGRVVDGALEERHAMVFERLDEPEVLLLAAFLHDVGKAMAGDHSIVGADVAREWLLRMGFGHRRADRVARLVRLHLLLPETSSRRDLDDDDEIAAVAARVVDVGTVDALYLLALADARATGPAAHSPWKDGLLAELHARVRAHLADRDEAGSRLTDPVAVAAEARRLLVDDDLEPEPMLAGLPRRYLLAASAEQVAAHARLYAARGGGAGVGIRRGPAPDTSTVSLVAPDRQGLMADAAGALAGHGLAVLEARAFTRGDGLAFDWFVVGSNPSGGMPDEATVVDALAGAAMGDVDVDDLVARRETGATRGPRPGLVTEPEVAFDRGPVVTRIEVRGPDAPGVLYRLGRVLADEGLEVVGARVATLGPEVRDVFFVRPTGGPPDMALLAAKLTAAAGWPATRGATEKPGTNHLDVHETDTNPSTLNQDASGLR